MPRQAFQLTMPGAHASPVVVASPHSGRDYDRAFMETVAIDSGSIRSSEDAYVDLLIEGAARFGVPVLAAGMPRAFVDLNRAAEELDPAVIDGVARGALNPRVSSGLGVIPRVVAQGRAIYRGKITRDEAKARIDRYWRPYHAKLEELLDRAHDSFGRAILLDCHSMPHEAIATHADRLDDAEIVLGDRFGSSADAYLVDTLEEIFVEHGFRVVRNSPFAGAYVTQAYGQPEQGRHAIQIEIDRALYIDEGTLERTQDFARIQAALTSIIGTFCERIDHSREMAAE